MKNKHRVLLFIDGCINLILGVILLFFPAGIVELLGLPPTNTYLCGSGALLAWLVFVPLSIPLHGRTILWIVATLVLIIGLAELVSKSWKYE